MQLVLDWRLNGDRIIADVSAILHTPFLAVRQAPIGLVLRMHDQAARIARNPKG